MTTHRRCGDCQLCCKLLPIPAGERLQDGRLVMDGVKPAGERCPHQCRKGCRAYDRRPLPCAIWNCRWLVNDDTADMPRPDRAHYVIDLMPDFVTAIDHATGTEQSIPVVQVWIDPNHREAHRDPVLRAYLERRGERERTAAVIRFSSSDGFVLFPPSMSADRQWHEEHGETRPEVGRHEKAAELARAGFALRAVFGEE
ncbi:MAG TPA: hypothetical protein VK630_15880 [Reyranella sp.]|nr:hypothetical protein [Reyranella sp.]